MTRKQACYYLGVRENASEEQIKRAYRYKVKLYHPDANPDANIRDYYICVQQAYEYLMSNPLENVAGTVKAEGGQFDRRTCPYYNGMPNMTAQTGFSNRTPYMNNVHSFYGPIQQNSRPAKVYASTADVRANYQRQKEKEKEHTKIQKWDKENREIKRRQQAESHGKNYAEWALRQTKGKEEEILEKIRAIWIAETIRRQIALDKEHREILQRRKLNKAFMRQKLQEEE